MKKAIIYCRVSTTMQDENDSLKNQIMQCESYCKSKGLIVTNIFSDVESGTHDDRKEYLKLKEEIEKNTFDVLIVYETSRISRKMIELLTFLNLLQEKRIDFISITESMFDTTTPEGKFAMSIRLSVIQLERDNTAKRVTERLRFKASQGQYVTGSPPRGYRLVNKKLVIDHEIAPMIKDIFQSYLNGESTYSLCQKYNLVWGGKEVKRILVNPIYVGKIRYGNRTNSRDQKIKNPFTAQGTHEPIISEEMFEQVQIMLKQKSRISKKSIENSIFNGLLKCSKCGHSYILVDKKNYYACHSKKLKNSDKFIYKDLKLCLNKNIKSDLLDKTIIEAIKETILNLDNLDDIDNQANDISNTYDEIDNLNRQKDRLLEAYIECRIDKANFIKKEAKLLERISLLKAKTSKVSKTINTKTNKERLLEYFEELNLDDKERAAAILRLIVDKIIVTKEPGTAKDDFTLELYLNII